MQYIKTYSYIAMATIRTLALKLNSISMWSKTMLYEINGPTKNEQRHQTNLHSHYSVTGWEEHLRQSAKGTTSN